MDLPPFLHTERQMAASFVAICRSFRLNSLKGAGLPVFKLDSLKDAILPLFLRVQATVNQVITQF